MHQDALPPRYLQMVGEVKLVTAPARPLNGQGTLATELHPFQPEPHQPLRAYHRTGNVPGYWGTVKIQI